MKPVIYQRHGKHYMKIGRTEVIEEGAMQSWCHGELQPIMNTDGETIGSTPEDFSDERDFYNPIDIIKIPSIPDPGSQEYEDMIDFMRKDFYGDKKDPNWFDTEWGNTVMGLTCGGLMIACLLRIGYLCCRIAGG